MKFSKSGILTLSGMLIANSFLLMATAYAIDSGKSIITKPDNARQVIEEIILSNGKKENMCSIILFDKSGSMFYKPNTKTIDKDEYGNVIPGDKWKAAVRGAIRYSQLQIEQEPTTKIGLIFFGYDATVQRNLEASALNEKYFYPPKKNEDTYLGKGVSEAINLFEKEKDCTQKYIILMTDGVPTDSYTNAVNLAKIKNITIYSIGYQIFDNGGNILRGISAGGFYDTKDKTIDQIFQQLSKKAEHTSITSKNNKLKIITENFIISLSGNQDETNTISENSLYSTILGGKGNKISAQSSFSSIIAGDSNSIQTSYYSDILGGKKNILDEGLNLVIIGGYNNKINSIIQQGGSSIGGGRDNSIINSYNSTIIGNNSIIEGGDSSIAMGSGTINYGKNSFYWTDGNKASLDQDNVFAIVSNRGMVVNTNTPHAAAQLTISGNLSITPNDNDENIVCGDGNGKGIIKAVQKNDKKDECLCSCNGTKRVSLYNGACESICNNEIAPTCGSSVGFSDSKYHGTCSSGTLIDTSYYVTKENIIHRACQTHDGNIANCTGTLN